MSFLNTVFYDQSDFQGFVYLFCFAVILNPYNFICEFFLQEKLTRDILCNGHVTEFKTTFITAGFYPELLENPELTNPVIRKEEGRRGWQQEREPEPRAWVTLTVSSVFLVAAFPLLTLVR